jgi:hypothetical protein
VPKGLARIRVEGIHGIILRGHDQHVAQPKARYHDSSRIQGLRIDVPVHWQDPQFAKIGGVDVRQGENLLVQVLAGPRGVIVVREHVGVQSSLEQAPAAVKQKQRQR